MNLEVFVSALIIGLMGAGHCLGMCGGIAAALGFAVPDASPSRKIQLIFAYNLGRISSYVGIGLIAGFLGAMLGASASGGMLLRVLAGVMLILMGFYLTGWWRVLMHLERLGALIWQRMQPIGQRLMPVTSLSAAFTLGVIWGWLPCGLVYSVVVLALAQSHPLGAATVMLGFGLGTLPAVMLGGLAAERVKRWLQQKALRAFMGLAVILMGLWTISIALMHQGHIDHSEARPVGAEHSPVKHHHH